MTNQDQSKLAGEWRIVDPKSGDPIAYALVTDNYPAIGCAMIDWIEVRPELRKQGLGTALIENILKRADELHITVLLDVASIGDTNDEVLLRFYEKFGFHTARMYRRMERKPR